MKARLRFFSFILIFCSLLLISGCATGPGGRMYMPGEAPHQLESGVVTKTETPIFVQPGGHYVYVSFGDTTGNAINFDQALKTALINRGFELVSHPDDADYQVLAKVTYLDFLKYNPNAKAIGETMGLMAGVATGVGLASTGATGPVGASLAGLGAAMVVGAIAEAVAHASAPEHYLAELHLQIRERITFIGRRPDNRPIEKWSKDTVKSGKKTYSVEHTRQERLSPIEETTSVARSGAANRKTTYRRGVADYETHQTVMRATIVMPSGAPVPEAINILATKVGLAVAGSL